MESNLDHFLQSLDNSPLKKRKELKTKTFFLALLTATAFFIPFIVYGKGYFIFYGDFNVQQIPFYQLCHRMIREGNVLWNWNTDLGVNFIGSYSFYTLGSPFFWLTLPFPEWMLPYLMGPLLILKFATAALTAYLYIRRFTRTPEAASLGALLYAFSGFSVYNIFFNHFHEAIILFPLLLLAVELFLSENRRGPVLFAVFACAFVNYFFFFGMVVFVILYWFVRTLSGCWRLTAGRFFALLLECVLGVLLAAAMLLPSFYAVIQNTRVDSTLYGWDAILHPRGQMYLNILEVFFFPPDIPARPVFFPNADVKWSSLGGWLPVFGLVGALTWMRSNKKHWIGRMVWICLFMALVPILNSAFTLFNTAYYARWFYMPILLLCLGTVMAVEDRNADWRPAWRWVTGITLAVTLVFGLMPREKVDDAFTVFGLYTNPTDPTYIVRFWATCAIALVGLIILRILMNGLKTDRIRFLKTSTTMVCILSVIYASFFIFCGETHSYNISSVMIDQLIEGEVDLPGDRTTYRTDVYDGVDNTGMFLGYDCINAFHSIVPGSVTEFYTYIGEDRGVASRPTTACYAARGLLSVRYLLNSKVSGATEFVSESGETALPGFSYREDQCNYRIYENDYYIPYGFTYDYYMTDETCKSASGMAQRANMMLKAILLDEDQIGKYGSLLKNLTDDYTILDYSSDKKSLDLSNAGYFADCKARAATAAYSFARDNTGFTAKIRLTKDNLVFFSVPYEKGWSATVNGVPVTVEKVNAGMMAVLAPAGDNEIRFEYRTPGLMLGIMVSGAALVLAVFYTVLCAAARKRHPDRWQIVYPEGKQLRDRYLAYEREENLERLDDKPDEIEAFYDGIDSRNAAESYDGSRFKDGFVVDVNILDRIKPTDPREDD